jgi:hypothetical protein
MSCSIRMIFLFSFGFHFHFCVSYLEEEVWTHETHQTERETMGNCTENELQLPLPNNWIRVKIFSDSFLLKTVYMYFLWLCGI